MDEPSLNITTNVYKKMTALPIIDEIDDLIREGVDAKAIAKYIKNTFKMLLEYDSYLIELAIRKRSKKLPKLRLVAEELPATYVAEEEEVRTPGKIARNQYNKATVAVDKLIELECLYLSARDRIDRKIKIENETGTFFDDLHQDYNIAMSALMKMAKIEAENGVSVNRLRMSVDIQGTPVTNIGNKLSTVMGNPESRHKVISMFRRMTEVAKLPPLPEMDVAGDG